MMMPSIFGENLFDDFMDFPFDDKWEKRMNKEFFGRKNPLYGKNAARLMKRMSVKQTLPTNWMWICPVSRKTKSRWSWRTAYLTISAEKGLDKEEEKKGKYIRRERYSGSCRRSFHIGDNLKEEDIRASFENGMLKLVFPKEEQRKAVEEKKYIAIE